MIIVRGFLILSLVQFWVMAGLAAVGAASAAVDPTVEDRFLGLDLAADELAVLQTGGAIMAGAGLLTHLLTMLATSRAAAATTGAVGAFLGAGVAGLLAAGLTGAPNTAVVDLLRGLVQPASIATIGVLSVLVGFRARLAHSGRWRYPSWSHGGHHHFYDSDGWGDDGGFD